MTKWIVWDEDFPDGREIEAGTGLEAVFLAAEQSYGGVPWEGPLQFLVREARDGSEAHMFVAVPKVTPVTFAICSGKLYRPSRPAARLHSEP